MVLSLYKMDKKPVLIIIAGPNGSGKTTITEKLLTHDWADKATYINPDLIAQEQFGGWNNKESFIKAASHAQEIRENCIKNKQNIIFETVFSTQGKIDFIQYAIDNNYFIRLFFIATNDPNINTKRIAIRVAKGGHSVPINKIISRYTKSINNCAKVINLIDRVYVYDNSIDYISPKLIFRVENNKDKVIKQYEELNDWMQVIFNNIT
jgi:predicted ABC-type ATPase